MPVLAANPPSRVLAVQRTGALLAPVAARGLLGRPATGHVLAHARAGALLARGPVAVGAVKQIYKGGSAPAAVPGYTLLWFESAGGDDYYWNVIE